MNVSETLQIISALRSSGATHFKSQDFEITLGQSAMLEQLIPPQPVAEKAQSQPSPIVTAVPENIEATEKLQGLIKTLQLPPEQLVDVIFPNGAGG